MQATLDYTGAQIADILYSRRLYYRKLGQLNRDHKAILQKMDHDYTPTKHVSDKFSNMTSWSEQLRSIVREEYCVYLQLCACYYRGVSLHVHLLAIHAGLQPTAQKTNSRDSACLDQTNSKCV